MSYFIKMMKQQYIGHSVRLGFFKTIKKNGKHPELVANLLDFESKSKSNL